MQNVSFVERTNRRVSVFAKGLTNSFFKLNITLCLCRNK